MKDGQKLNIGYVLIISAILIYLVLNIIMGFTKGELFFKYPVNLYKDSEPIQFMMLLIAYIALFVIFVGMNIHYIRLIKQKNK